MADPVEPETPYQSLYRRFRPQRFGEVLGQEHVSLALRNAVRDDRVGHAYLFSGPRGTGKTSTARILAKALNCTDLDEGEPCGTCSSCVEIARGTSLDVHELDAASNNGVDAMRDLVSRAALGTPGRWKVYIVDEVHMLSTAASNALLKTLEEPPGHVVFVLATTDPQKVLPTIRSRTQHFEFRLLGAETLSGLLRGVHEAAGLALSDEAIDSAVRKGRGSARDALSALDQVAAGGEVEDESPLLAELGEALAERDPGRALVAVARAAATGRDAMRLAGELAEYLRQGFLASVAPELVAVAGADLDHVTGLGRRLGLAAVVRAMEELGRAQVAMRDAPDPRIHLEVVLIRLTHPEADDSPAAILERLERLERSLADGGPARAAVPVGEPPARTAPTAAPARPGAEPAPAGAGPVPTDPGPATGGPDLARQTLGAIRRQAQAAADGPPPAAPAPAEVSPPPVTPPPVESPPANDAPPPAPTDAPPTGGGTMPNRDQLVQAWGDSVLAALPARPRARFKVGRFVAVEGGTAVFALPNETHRSYCEEVRHDVEEVLSAHFVVPVALRLVVEPDERPPAGEVPVVDGPGPGPDEPDLLDPAVLAAETEPAGAGLSPADRVKQAFPGAEEV